MGTVASLVSAASGPWGATSGAAKLALGLEGAQTGLGFMQGQQAAQAASLRGRFENDVAERNAEIADKQAADAINTGTLDANRALGETGQQSSSTRAALAAQGVDITTGSAAAQTASQQLIGDVDALTIRDNAARQAWGFDVQAANQRMQGRLAQLAGENEAATDRVSSVSTLLTGAASAYTLAKRARLPGTSGLTAPTLLVG